MERQLSQRPTIATPSVVLYGANDGVAPPPADTPAERALFPGRVGRQVLAGVGHFLPREKPDIVSSAMLELLGGTR
jgi:pimeloyl-ACP methyl ester carboxylesterase